MVNDELNPLKIARLVKDPFIEPLHDAIVVVNVLRTQFSEQIVVHVAVTYTHLLLDDHHVQNSVHHVDDRVPENPTAPFLSCASSLSLLLL